MVQAILTFTISCFRLLVGLCLDIEMLIRKFWWGQREDRQEIHWKKWDVLCKPKVEGGVCFEDLCKFNEAMLAKQVWRLVHNKSSLFYEVFEAKYFPRGSIFEATSSSKSYAWKNILRSRHLIEEGEKWRLGDGQSIRIFIDKWLPSGDGKISSSSGELHPEAIVSKLINTSSGWWNI